MRGPRSSSWRFAAVLAGVALAAGAQTKSAPPDPYTGGDPDALTRAGYVAVGSFDCVVHTTADVEELLGDETLAWIETAHFRLGCALSPVATGRGDREWKTAVKAELTRLAERLPNVKPSVRTLDPWLRAHLVAQRLEELYAEVQQSLGVRDADFPATPMDPRTAPAEYMGEGPYLGMREKFVVVVVKRTASNARYTRKYAGHEADHPLRIYFPGGVTLGVCAPEEYNKGQLANDLVLQVHLAYNVVANLLNAYRSYGHEVPPWLSLGMAHWYARRVSPRYPIYDIRDEREREDSAFWKWDDRALGLMKNDVFEPLDELLARRDSTKFGMEQHIQAWFFVDYLMHARREELARFVRSFKDPLHERQRSPTPEELLARQAECFRSAFGVEPAELEVEWRERTRKLAHRRG